MEKLPDVQSVQSMVSIAKMMELVRLCEEQELAIDAEMRKSFAAREQIEMKLELLDVIPTKLKPVNKEVKVLGQKIDETCKLADTLSSKVRHLDTIRDRVRVVSKKVEDIVQVKNCINGVHSAIEAEDWEKACAYIGTYLSIDCSMLEPSAVQQLQQATEQLQAVIRERFEASQATQDPKATFRFAKLFIPLGLSSEGLQKYILFLRSEFKTTGEQEWRSLEISKGADPAVYIEAITKLFESLASIVQDEIVNVEEFGPGSGLQLLRSLQQQCDIHSTTILSTLMEKLQVSQLCKQIQAATRRGNDSSKVAASTLLETQPFSQILDLIATMSQRCEMYDRFLRAKAEDLESAIASTSLTINTSSPSSSSSSSSSETHAEPTEKKRVGLMNQSEINRQMQQMMDDYIRIEDYFITENVNKAVRMNTQSNTDQISSMVDHVFFVLKKSLIRSVSTLNINSVCAISNIISSILGHRFSQEIANLTTNKYLTVSRTDHQRYMLAINNYQVSSEYILKLKTEVEREVARAFAESQKSKDKAKTCFNDLLEVSKQYKSACQKNIEELISSFQPKIKQIIDLFRQTSYDFTDLDFEKDTENLFLARYLEEVDKFLAIFKAHLNDANFESVVHIMIRTTTSSFETILVQQKRFSQVGALQFDRDLRAIVNYFSEKTQKPARAEFSRLLQMASVINLDQPSQILESWGENSGQVNWRLTGAEVRKLLSRRIEFRPEEIAALSL